MSYRLEIGTALLLAVAIAIGIWAANRKERTPDLDFRTSTYLNGPRGSKALHDVLTRLGRPSERRRTPLYTLATERAHRPAILVLLNPVIDLQDGELEQVTRYTRDGGAVVAVGDGGGVTACAGWRTQSGGIGNTDTIGVRSLQTEARLPPTSLVLTARKSAPSEPERLEKLRKGATEDSEPEHTAAVRGRYRRRRVEQSPGGPASPLSRRRYDYARRGSGVVYEPRLARYRRSHRAVAAAHAAAGTAGPGRVG